MLQKLLLQVEDRHSIAYRADDRVAGVVENQISFAVYSSK